MRSKLSQLSNYNYARCWTFQLSTFISFDQQQQQMHKPNGGQLIILKHCYNATKHVLKRFFCSIMLITNTRRIHSVALEIIEYYFSSSSHSLHSCVFFSLALNLSWALCVRVRCRMYPKESIVSRLSCLLNCFKFSTCIIDGIELIIHQIQIILDVQNHNDILAIKHEQKKTKKKRKNVLWIELILFLFTIRILHVQFFPLVLFCHTSIFGGFANAPRSHFFLQNASHSMWQTYSTHFVNVFLFERQRDTL